MLTKRIIPCLDVDRGRVVKGVNFVNLRDAGDPVEVARRYEEQGADELVFLDISASHEGRAIMLDVVRRVSEEIFMPFTVGGGIRTLDDATRLIQAGAEKVSINSAAVKTPELVTRGRRQVRPLRHRGQHRPAPRRSRRDGRTDESWEVHINGGRVPTGLEAVAWAQRVEELGAGEIVLTSMDADGTKAGYDLAMTRAVAEAVAHPGRRQRRGRAPRASVPGADRRQGRRRPGRQHLPLQRVRHPRDQGVPGRARRAGPAESSSTASRPEQATS